MSPESPDEVTMLKLESLSRRFAGVDLQFRRGGANSTGNPDIDWPAPWRARMVTSKNERAEYRVKVYGETASEAIHNLAAAVSRIDEGR